MKVIIARCYWFLYRRAIARLEPDAPKRAVIKQFLYQAIRFAIKYYKH